MQRSIAFLRGPLWLLAGVAAALAVAGCGGGGSGHPVAISQSSSTMSVTSSGPYTLVGANDDDAGHFINAGDELYSVASAFNVSYGDTILIRVADPYSVGGTYSLKVRPNGYGGIFGGTPSANAGEPDNDPSMATVVTDNQVSDRDLNPAGDEDWFSYTVTANPGELFAQTKSNGGGSSADTSVEIYRDSPDSSTQRSFTTSQMYPPYYFPGIASAYSAGANATLVGVILRGDLDDSDVLLIAFSGQGVGAHPITDAFPPYGGTTSGNVNVSQYGQPGSRIVGTYSLSISMSFGTFSYSGDFNIIRGSNIAGLSTSSSVNATHTGNLRSLFRELTHRMN